MHNRLPCGLTLVFFFFIIMTSIAGLSYDTLNVRVSAQPSNMGEGSFLTYQNPDYGVTIQYPYDWKKTTGDPYFNQVVLFSAPEIRDEKSSTLISIFTPAEVVVAVENISNRNSSLKEYTDRYLQRVIATANDFQIINSSSYILAGNPAQRIISEEIDITGHISEVMRIVALKDGIAYRIGYFAEPETFSNYLPITQRMIDSFEITGRPNSNLLQQEQQRQPANDDLQLLSQKQNNSSSNNGTALSTQQKLTGSTSENSLQKLPQNLLLRDNLGNNAELPLRSAIISGNVSDSGVADLPEGKLFGYNPLLTIQFLGRPSIGVVNVGHLLIGQIKTYESLEDILGSALYWENLPLNDEIVLRLDHAGFNFIIASVQFANGTSGIYSSVVNIEPDQESKATSDYWFEQDIGEGAQFNIMDNSVVSDIVDSDPIFYQKASSLICSHLETYGFQICKEGATDAVSEDNIGISSADEDQDEIGLEQNEDDEEDEDQEDDDDDNNDDNEENNNDEEDEN